MTRLTNHFVLLFLVFTAAAIAVAQDLRTLGRIEFQGLQQITPDQALATSGLKPDQPFKVEEIDAAAQRLLDSGIFNQIGYRTRTVGNKVTITFQVEEARGGESPVVFDNFIWFTEEQLQDAVRREVPAFAGHAPNLGKTPEAITRALQQLLAEHKLPGTVTYLASSDLSGRVLGHVFSVTGVKLPICTFHFPGAKNISEAKLVGTAKEMADADYSSELVRAFAGMKLYAIYREAGQLRAKFAAPMGLPDPKCKNGVDVTIPVDEGLIYSWGPADWSGANALTADQLNQILGAKPGEVANGLQFDKGVLAVMKAYGREGHLDVRVRPTPEFDDNARQVVYKIEVREGPQYRMGSLLFKGLTERDAKALRGAWRLRRGEIFDQGYLEDFFKSDLGNAMQRLFEERQAVGKPPPRVETHLNPNKETLTVDVTLELVN
ncbi:MAG TPA: POTRA domain-containing protein [Pyrinomonadaceae bacterium]|jgi:outer membrane protein assembly factor BamA|nr:POTRA domain-containing protein [Pyrinomonadaceae bacterium]